MTAQQRAEVEAGVRRGLKDPVSAMFGGMNAGVSEGDPNMYIVCGWVNSKNSFGGYVGEQPFIATYFPKLKKALLIGVGGSRIDTTVVQKQCDDYGVSLGI
jgi:hypothetical protein